MTNNAPVLYLASKSPRRREILASMGIADVRVLHAGPAILTAYEGDETQRPGESCEDYVVRTACDKARQALARIRTENLPPLPVLAADTVVICEGVILGKPADRGEARRFMQTLSGRTHEVRTAVAVADGVSDELVTAVSVSQVEFAPLTDAQIEAYIACDEPYDKAGGYAVQGLAGLFIRRIAGSYSGIMGLPVFETAALLGKVAPHLLPACARGA